MLASAKVRQRKAVIGDLTTLMHLRRASLRVLAAEAYDRTAIEALSRDTRADEERMIADGTLYVLELDGEVVAYGGWSADALQAVTDQRAEIDQDGSSPAWVQSIYVDPSFAREGLGSRLMALLEREAAARGCLAVKLATTLNAMPFCTAMGYWPVGLVQELVPGNAQLIGALMVKQVAARVAQAA